MQKQIYLLWQYRNLGIFRNLKGERALKKIVICEDHRIVYDGLELLLKQSKEFVLMGYAPQGKDLPPLLAKTQPDVIILDLNLPDIDGFALLREIRKSDQQVKVIILTMYHDGFLIEKAKNEGANAYLLKNSSNEELLSALRDVEAGGFFVTNTIQEEMERKKVYRDRFAQKMKLTRREVEVIQRLARGFNTQEIADQLFLSPHTIETHRKNIFRKLEINSIADLVRFAHDNGIL
jgi:DNA-binding NarL/FixJ family response regulator